MRILPRVNDAVNEEWISDKARQIVDGLKTKRLDKPYVREGGKLRPATWREAFALIAEKIKAAPPARIGAIAGDLVAVEEMFALQIAVRERSASSRSIAARTGPRSIRNSAAPAICSIRQSPGSRRRTAS